MPNSNMMTFKQKLARVFDDNLRTSQWYNIVDYVIIGLIVISTLEVFFSTFDGIVARYNVWLKAVDYITTAVFTIEVSLRIWCADLIDERYKGFRGRLRYCFSFYGLIDILSTFPFYVSLFFPVPYTALKTFRILRLLRVFRYVKAFNVLARAVKSKQKELVVSLEFLTIVTLLLSFVLYFVEHDAQPDVYDNGWVSVAWSFLQYVGDPGGFADTPPVTPIGHIVAVIVGLLGIAIFAVPAGLIGSAFSEVMEEDEAEKELKETQQKIVRSFKFVHDQHYTRMYFVPRYVPLTTVSSDRFLTKLQIFKTIEQSDCLHLYNLAKTLNKQDNPVDKMVLVNFAKNTDYGCRIDRDSNVTIVCTSGYTEPLAGWFAYHVAKLGGFNYVGREIETDPYTPTSYYSISPDARCPNLPKFIDDINLLSNKENTWVITIIGTEGARNRPSQLHFCYNSQKQDASYNDPQSRVHDYESFDRMYKEVERVMPERFGLVPDKNEWYGISQKNIAHSLAAENVFTLRVAGFVLAYDEALCGIAKQMADIFRESFEPGKAEPQPPEMMKRQTNHDFGMPDYVD